MGLGGATAIHVRARRCRTPRWMIDVNHVVVEAPGILARPADVRVLRHGRLAVSPRARLHIEMAIHRVPVARRFLVRETGKSRKQQIDDLKSQRQEMAEKAAEDDKKIADRIREIQKGEAKAERRRQNQRKYVVGAWVLDAVKSNTEISLAWYNDKVADLTRKDQRELFNLEPLEDGPNGNAGADTADDAAVVPTPITANQKDWLQRLVDQQPELAKQLGVQARASLENLGKNKASEFIATATDRLNQMRVRLKKDSKDS